MTVDEANEVVDCLGQLYHDPAAWVWFAFDWEHDPELAGMEPQPWQLEQLRKIRDHINTPNEVIRQAVSSGHGIGKSALVSWIILWAISTFPDTRGVVTANTEAQLRTKTWAELAKWHRRFVGKDLFKLTATSIFCMEAGHERTWRIDAIPWSKENTEAFAGLHNQGNRIFLIFDEASAIDDAIWEVTEGALTDMDTEIIWCCYGNPTRNTGRFHDCFTRYRNYWDTVKIDSRDVPISNKAQIRQWQDLYGEESDFFKVRVRGEFPSTSENQFISLDLVETAQKQMIRPAQYNFAPVILGVDMAWSGSDATVIYMRQGLYSKKLASYQKNDNDGVIAAKVAAFEDEYHADAVFIDQGYGTGVYSFGVTMGRTWRLVSFAASSGKRGYANKLAEMWGDLREWLRDGGVLEDGDVIHDDDSVTQAIQDVLENGQYITRNITRDGRTRIVIYRENGEYGAKVLLDYDKQGKFYSIVNIIPQGKKQINKRKKEALSTVKGETLTTATGSGSFYTSRTTKAGSSDDSLLGVDNASITYSLAEADEKYKDFVYDETPVFEQPITNMDVKLDEAAPVITIQEKYAGMDWRDLRNKLPDNIENAIVSKRDVNGQYIPIVNKETGNKVIITKGSISHFKTAQTSTENSQLLRRNSLHYEIIEAVPEIIEQGIWTEEHVDHHEKALGITRIIAPVKINSDVYVVKLTVKREKNKYLVTQGDYTHFRAYDVGFMENKESGIGSNFSGNSDAKSDHRQPIPIPDSYTISIREFLKHVNDDQGKPYVNADGTANYGIYFGNEKTGGVLFIRPQQTYEQHTGSGIRGAYDSSSGILHLFDAANQSTFIHEAAHMWFSDAEQMAQQDGAPKQLRDDVRTIRKWASYDPAQLAEYAGTTLEKEFKGHAAAIEAARQSGDVVAVKAAEEQWMQERFARAFEQYVMTGKAPVRELQTPFRKFKQWLVSIYRELTNLGKEPPEEVRHVMNRMLATDEEIETWAREKELNAWDRKGFAGDLSGSEGKMIQEWSRKIKEQAKEKLLKNKMDALRVQYERERKEEWELQRLETERKIAAEHPVYQYENIWNHAPEQRPAILKALGMEEEAEFRNALKEAGGSLKERVDAEMEEVRETYTSISEEEIRHDADEWLAGTNGKLALNELEANAMRRQLNRYIAECVKALRETGNAQGTDAEISAQLRKVLNVETTADKEKARKGAIRDTILSKNREIADLKKKLSAMKDKSNTTREENEQTIKVLKNGLQEVMHGLRAARDMTTGTYMEMLRAAREELDDMKVSDATSWRRFELKAATANKRADQYMSAGEFERAMTEKGNAQKFLCLSRAAKDNKEFIRKSMQGENGRIHDESGENIDGMLGILGRISRTKNPVRMNPHVRYVMQHLAYNLGMINKDGRPPLDKNGIPEPLNWEVIYSSLSPDYAMDKKSIQGKDIVAPWIRVIADGNERLSYNDMPMIQFRDINELIRAMYKVGKRDYEGKSIVGDDGKRLSMADAAKELTETMHHSNKYNPEQEKNNQTWRQRQKEKLSDAMLALTKPEILLQNMGRSAADGKKWIQYIYRPLDAGSTKELSMKESAMREFSHIRNIYSWKEWQTLRNDRVYALGGIHKYTKEQILAIALNWGNKEGRQRIVDEVKKNMKITDDHVARTTIEDRLAAYLTDKDLDFIEAVWKQVGQYWPERNKVQENLYGMGMGRVPPQPYNINGRTVSGGYYPIVYDRELSSRTSELEQEDIAQALISSNAKMAVGMGSTKKRAAKVTNQTVAKTLDIWPNSVNESIHHICMREAVTDVYRLLSHPDIEARIQENYGIQTYNALKDWVRDCWKTDIQKQDGITRTLERMRRATSFAVMGYRTSTALLNTLNIFPMMKEIGVANTMRALGSFGLGFYKGLPKYARNRRFVMEHSAFMAERMNTLDKDLQQQMNIPVSSRDSPAMARAKVMRDAVNRYAYLFIQETDLMLSMALWKWKYDDTISKQITAGRTDESVMQDNAVFEADKTVRNILGSGMAKDQAAIQRQNGLAAQMAPFYSYSSAVMNAMIDAGYKWKKGNHVAMCNAMIFWILVPTIFETLIRSAMNGEDDPEKIMKKMGVSTLKNTAQGIPVVRDAVDMAGNYLFDLPTYGSGSSVLAVSMLDEFGKTVDAAMSDKKDMTDMARHATRMLNRYAGFSDTLTDGFWSLMRFSMYDTDRSFAELCSAFLFDKRYRIAAERIAAEKKKDKAKRKEEKK